MADTIAAVATSLSSAAGINIIRISGDKAKSIADKIFVCRKITDGYMEPNRMYLGKIDGKNFSERAFCVYCKSPFSYTGEDVIEIHCHGGKGITLAIMRIVRENGARPAEPGEFTKRAFLNGKLSLAEAEGVIDMINASSESQIRNAYRLMSGELTKGITESETLLTETAAMLEAKLDYPEELEEEVRPLAKRNIDYAYEKIKRLLDNASLRKTLNEGVDIAIIGIPNVGKSSLLNAFIGQDRAIVSDEAGTTRDVVKESIEVNGIKLNFIDTAGIRDGAEINKAERMGIERSKKAVESADVILNVIDLSVPESEGEREINALTEGKEVIFVANKSDKENFPRKGIKISAEKGEGIEAVIDEIMKRTKRESIYSEGVITNERHIYALEECERQLSEGKSNYDILPSECILENVRCALESLGRITGKNASENVINEVFSRFCVGK